MLTPEQLSAYLDGSLDANELARVEAILASDADARRQVLEQRAMDQALRVALGGAEAETRLKRSVLAVTRGQSLLKLKARVLHDTSEQEKVSPLPQAGHLKPQPRNGRSFGWMTGLAAAASLALTAAWWFFPPRVAELADVTHEIEVKRGWFTVKGREAAALRRGDVVSVKGNSAAAVRYADGTLLPLAAGTVVELGKPDGTNAGKRIQLRDGLLAARVTKQAPGEELVITTSQALVRVVGTEFALAVENGATQLVMEEGAVKFSALGTDVQEVRGGQLALADPTARIKVNVKPVERDAAQWPFAVDSPWNRPLGNGARLTPIKPAASFGELRGVMKPVRIEVASTNGRTLRLMRQNREVATIPAPADFSLNGATAEMHFVVTPDRQSAWEIVGSRPTSAPGELAVLFAQRGSLTGSGFGNEWAVIPRQGASALGGVIRRGEATTGIRHALQLRVGAAQLNARPAVVWPATIASGINTPPFGTSGNLHLGALLALPPDVDFRALGLGNSGPAYEIARALRDFGAYIGSADPEPLRVLVATDAGLPLDGEMDRLFNKLLPLLQLVINNTPATPAGGGLPGRAPAPPLAK